MENSPTRILIIDTAWLGDVLFTTSLIGAVRSVWPQTEIDLLTSPRSEQLVQHHPDLRQVRIYDKQKRERGIGSLRALAKKLNSESYDAVLCSHPSPRSRVLCALLKSPVRVGYDGWLDSFSFTHTVHNNLAVEPDHVERRLSLLRKIHPVETTPPLRVGITAEESGWAENWLNSRNCAGTTLLGLIPGSARRTKQWETTRFLTLAGKWLASDGMRRVLVFLGPLEREMAGVFAGTGNDRIIVVEETLRNCAALLNRCDTALGNDTGVSFLAIAAGCPKVLVLYGSTQMNYTFPPPHKAIAAGVPCCLLRTGHGEAKCRWTGGAPWCMGELSIERVLSELTK